MGSLLSFKGRIARLNYILFNLAAWAVFIIIGTAASAMEPIGFLYVLAFLALIIFSAMLVVKRLHDIDRPGTHFWLSFIPLYNIYFGIVLLIQPGTYGPNRFGKDPLNLHLEEPVKSGTSNTSEQAAARLHSKGVKLEEYKQYKKAHDKYWEVIVNYPESDASKTAKESIDSLEKRGLVESI